MDRPDMVGAGRREGTEPDGTRRGAGAAQEPLEAEIKIETAVEECVAQGVVVMAVAVVVVVTATGEITATAETAMRAVCMVSTSSRSSTMASAAAAWTNHSGPSSPS
jgi:hypothetical protein